MIYGYYIAHSRTRHGDPELARLARLLWRAFGHRAPSRVDGVSVWTTEEGLTAKLVARDLFNVGLWQRATYPAFEVPLCRVHPLV